MRPVHELKILPDNFEKVIHEVMTFQIRKHDRDFAVGDILFLQEHDGEVFTGRTVPCKLNHILDSTDGLQEGYVLLNIKLKSIHIDKQGKRYVTKL